MTDAPPLPFGFGIELDARTRVLARGSVVVGGDSGRMLRLSPGATVALDRLRSDPVADPVAAVVARRLVSAGLAHPRPPRPASAPRVQVVVPVRNRVVELDRCLSALAGHDTVVVDDGSDDPNGVAAVVARHGARLVARAAPGGPAAARNAARHVVNAALVAFVDSDCVVPHGWLETLTSHFADPLVGAVAPRVVGHGAPTGGVLAAYAAARSPLDLGARPALVQPGRSVPYVPTAALVARRSAMPAFDETLRHGEDVDAVWRMIDAGWQVRYEPAVTVVHHEPGDWREFLGRRFRYGTSAGPLARRHAERLAPLVVSWPAAVPALLLARRPVVAGALTAVLGARVARRVRRLGLPHREAQAMAARALGAGVLGVAAAAAQHAPLVAALAAAAPGRRGGRLVTAGALAALPALVEWTRRRPGVDPIRWTAATLLDEAAYGAGVWAGAVRSRTLVPLLPRTRRSLVSAQAARVRGAGALLAGEVRRDDHVVAAQLRDRRTAETA